MPYTSIVRKPVLYASWRGFVAGDLRDVTREIEVLRAKLGAPAVYFARLPGSGGIFTPDETAALLDFLRGIVPLCTAIHHVIEGDGFIKSARMASLRTMARQTRRPGAFVVHDELAAAVAQIKTEYGPDFTDLVARRESKQPRASSAFRAAAKIVEPKKKKT